MCPWVVSFSSSPKIYYHYGASVLMIVVSFIIIPYCCLRMSSRQPILSYLTELSSLWLFVYKYSLPRIAECLHFHTLQILLNCLCIALSRFSVFFVLNLLFLDSGFPHQKLFFESYCWVYSGDFQLINSGILILEARTQCALIFSIMWLSPSSSLNIRPLSLHYS